MNSKNNSLSMFLQAIFLLALFSTGCVKKPEMQVESHEEASATEVMLTADQQKAIGLQLDTIIRRNLSSTLKVNGKVEAPPQNKAEVNILTGGIVKTITIREGEFVQKGHVLTTMENLEFIQLQQDYLSGQANLVFLNQNMSVNATCKKIISTLPKL